MSIENKKENTMKYFQEIEKTPPEVYYHYTSVESLFHIVESQTFRLTNLRSSNDKKELFYTYSQFCVDIDKIIREEKSDSRKKILQELKEKANTITIKADKKEEVFALCLCEQKDSLTHWDRYTGNCKGVSIALNVAALQILYNRYNIDFFTDQLFKTDYIAYSDDDRLRLINHTIDFFVKRFLDLKEQGKIESGSGLMKTILPVAYSDVRTFIKNSAFFDEDEIRLLYSSLSCDTISDIINSVAPSISDDFYNNVSEHYSQMIDTMKIREKQFACFKGGIRSYHDLCLKDIWGDGLIPEIILGPMCTQSKGELRAFLDKYGLKKTRIYESKVPIR